MTYKKKFKTIFGSSFRGNSTKFEFGFRMCCGADVRVATYSPKLDKRCLSNLGNLLLNTAVYIWINLNKTAINLRLSNTIQSRVKPIGHKLFATFAIQKLLMPDRFERPRWLL